MSMGRSDSLPGREGVFIHPVVPEKTWRMQLPVYKESGMNTSLCFECLDGALPPEGKDALQKVYDAYLVEMHYAEQRKKGLRIDRIGESKELEAAKKSIPDTCLVTGNHIADGGLYFVCYVIDRINSELGSFFWAQMMDGNKYGNYQVTLPTEESRTSFFLSSEALGKSFKRTFGELERMLKGDPTPAEAGPHEIMVSDNAREAIEKGTGKPLERYLSEEGFNVKVSRLKLPAKSKDH
jgi:hypothetical protein